MFTFSRRKSCPTTSGCNCNPCNQCKNFGLLFTYREYIVKEFLPWRRINKKKEALRISVDLGWKIIIFKSKNDYSLEILKISVEKVIRLFKKFTFAGLIVHKKFFENSFDWFFLIHSIELMWFLFVLIFFC